MRTLAGITLALLLAACGRPEAVVPPVDPPAVQETPVKAPAVVQEAVVAEEPLPTAVETVSEAVQAPVIEAMESLEQVLPAAPELPVEDDRMQQCRHAAADLIVRWEITGARYYGRHLRVPIWPKGQSGITWGVGYDGGHQTTRTILLDWSDHTAVDRLAQTAGITGKRAAAILKKYKDIPTEYEHAFRVFETRSLIEYERITERTYRIDLADVPVGVCASLVSLTYNRGGATTGDSRKEIRNIRDTHLPAKNWDGVAAEIRAMKRLWRGTVNEKGLSARRESEALLIEKLS